MGSLDSHQDLPWLDRNLRSLGATLRMIQFEHTVFALPFALMGAVLAASGIPSLRTLSWILGAMVGARSAAMTFNRLVDQVYDSKNPRTATRPLVTGRLTRSFAWTFLGLSSALFIFSAAMLNSLSLVLSLPVLALILGYSYTKRLTWGAHFFLGASLGCAPLGAWIAVRGAAEFPPMLLSLAVLFWTAGFDIIYACQDAEFDRVQGLHSIPERWGVGRALIFSRILHGLMLLVLLQLGRILSLGAIYFGGLAMTGFLLAYEHSLVSKHDLSRVNRAFFTVNGCISIFLFATTLGDQIRPG
jgi:4-hydroxybenzoate polyprenyltransferase